MSETTRLSKKRKGNQSDPKNREQQSRSIVFPRANEIISSYLDMIRSFQFNSFQEWFDRHTVDNFMFFVMRLQEHSLYPVSVYKEVSGKSSSCSFIYTRMMTVPDGVFNLKISGIYPSITDPDALCMIVCDYSCVATKLFETEAIEEEEVGETDQHQNDLELAVASLNRMAHFKQQNEMPLDNGVFSVASSYYPDENNVEPMDESDNERSTSGDSSISDDIAATTLAAFSQSTHQDLKQHNQQSLRPKEAVSIGEETRNNPGVGHGHAVSVPTDDYSVSSSHLSTQLEPVPNSISTSSTTASSSQSKPSHLHPNQLTILPLPPVSNSLGSHNATTSASTSTQNTSIQLPPSQSQSQSQSQLQPDTLISHITAATYSNTSASTSASTTTNANTVFPSSPISYHALSSTSTSISSTGLGVYPMKNVTKTVFTQKKVRLVDRIPIFVAKPGAMFRMGERYPNEGIRFNLSSKIEFYINKDEKVYKIRYLMNS